MRADEHQQQLDERRQWEDEQLANDPGYTQFTEETSMDMSQYGKSDSNDLKAADFIGKNFKLTIAKVGIRNFEASDKQPANSRPELSFEGKDKVLVVNATNTKILCTAYGDQSDGWIGRTIGLAVADYTSKGFGHGWLITPLDVPAPDFDDDLPF